MGISSISPRIRILAVAAIVVISFTAYQVFAATTVGTNFSTDGNSTVNGNTALGDTTGDTTTVQGQTTITTLATGLLNVLTGNLKVGDGAPTVTLGGEDAYVEGTFEVDGASRFDGVVTFGSTVASNITPSVSPAAANTVDTSGANIGQYTSLVLDSSGFPVISYYEGVMNYNLKVTHCNDADCAGANETITTVDSTGDVGQYTSLVLDSSGFPIISYYDATNFDLKVMHCNDANCAGANETITTVDSTGDVGQYTSLVLDSSGFPIISYYDATNFDLKVMHCNDANCAGANETITTADSTGFVGQHTSIVLDSSGFPIISYNNFGNGYLKMIHCSNANCTVDGYDIGSSSSFFKNLYGSAYYGKSTTISSFDLAETYAVHDTSIEAGDIVAVAREQKSGVETGEIDTQPFVEKTVTSYQDDAIGIVSTKPGLIL